MKTIRNVTEIIGDTPMIKLATPERSAELYAKLEYMNPSGSVKDRIAKQMIEAAQRRGAIKPRDTIVEATSGNTGIGLAMVGAAMGYSVVIVMPATASAERRSVMKHYGARVVLTPAADFVKGAMSKAKELAKRPGWWMPSQFENFDNVAAHMENTGKEIIDQVPGGRVDAFAAGIGTGGTIMGVAKALRKRNPGVRIVAVEPVGLKDEAPRKIKSHLEIIDHQVEGIGDGFVPAIVEEGMINEWVPVSDEDAIETACCLTRENGLFVGISSGANVFASMIVAKKLGAGKNVVTILPDSADRYYTTGLFRASCCKRRTDE